MSWCYVSASDLAIAARTAELYLIGLQRAGKLKGGPLVEPPPPAAEEAGPGNPLYYHQPLEVVAEDLGVTRERVRQIQNKAIDRLRRTAEALGGEEEQLVGHFRRGADAELVARPRSRWTRSHEIERTRQG